MHLKADSCKRDFLERMNGILSNEITTIMNFESFLKQNMSIVNSIKEESVRNNLFKIRDELNIILEDVRIPEIARIGYVSKGKELIQKANGLLERITEELLNARYQSIREQVSSLQKLCLKYSDKKNEVNKKFQNLLDFLDAERKGLKDKAMEEIIKQKDLKRWIVEEPGTRSYHYQEKAQSLVKELISAKHFDYLSKAMTEIYNKKLMSFLMSLYEDEGEKNLIERLEFLREMEKNGLLSYRT